VNWVDRLGFWMPYGNVPEVAPGDLQSALAQAPGSWMVLDVRTAFEWRRGRIAGAVRCPIRGLRKRLAALGLDSSSPIAVVCLTAHRSIPAVRVLRRAGFSGARQLGGGMRAWRAAGLPEIRS
jgi:rhodanese-related sulfurtransferase